MKLSLMHLIIFTFQFDRAKLTENESSNDNEITSNTTVKETGMNISHTKR